MARPKQDGLLYFSLDTDFFYADRRIKRLHAKFGNDGMVFYIYLLTEIYRNGYYASWDGESVEDAAADLRLKEGFIEQAMEYLRGRSLLVMSKLSTGVTVITSPGIQKRYQEAVKSRRRDVEVDAEIWLLKKEDTASFIKVTVNEDKPCGNGNKSCGNERKTRENGIKESKGKKSKGKKTEGAGAEADLRRVEAFLSAYPKSCNRHLTERAYMDLLLTGKVTEGELLQCAANYAESCRALETPERYVKNAENFLKDFTFEKYMPGKYEKPAPKKAKNGFQNFTQREYDYDELEKALLNR